MAKVPVFISWSGEYAKDMASTLRTFLQGALQATKPFVSSRDIAPGTPWFEKIRDELQAAPIAIICVTKEALDARWLNFEAGAMAMVKNKERVIPYCIDIKKGACGSPLNQLQAVDSDEDGTFEMFKAINDVLGESRLDDPRTVFDMWYPRLKADRSTADAREAERRGTENVGVQEAVTDDRLRNIEESLGMLRRTLEEQNQANVARLLRSIEDHSLDAQLGFYRPRGAARGTSQVSRDRVELTVRKLVDELLKELDNAGVRVGESDERPSETHLSYDLFAEAMGEVSTWPGATVPRRKLKEVVRSLLDKRLVLSPYPR